MADLHAPEPAANGTDAGAAAESADGPAAPAPPYSKRRRRPSVRLGDIGARTTAAADLSLQRHPKPPTSSHVRSPRLAHSDENAEPHRRAPRPPPRRARSAWLLAGGDGYEQEGEPYDEEAGEELSNSAAAAPATARVSRSLEANPEFAGDESDGVAEWGLPNGRFAVPVRCRVRTWLDGLGLGRYAPVFEIHEVDNEVLPLLTLEDLKEMGIGAVGSRRKMYAAIQKLRRNAVS